MDILKKNNEKDKNKNKKGAANYPAAVFNNIIGAILIFIAIVAAYSLVSRAEKKWRK